MTNLLGTLRINDLGAVAFTADLSAGGRAALVGDGGPLTTLYDTAQHFFDIVATSGLNNSGRVHLLANPTAGVTGIYTGDGGPLTTIADTSDAFSDIRPASMNQAGLMAFRGTLRAGGQAILLGDGGPLTIYALAGGVYANFGTAVGGLAHNNAGTVAFEASLRAGGRGIFTGADPVADKVLAVGDALFGSTVTGLDNAFFNSSLNDRGQLAFRATLWRTAGWSSPVPTPMAARSAVRTRYSA